MYVSSSWVNAQDINPLSIKPSLKPHEAIFEAHPKLRTIIDGTSPFGLNVISDALVSAAFASAGLSQKACTNVAARTSSYTMQVFNQYEQFGGNYHVIIYGFMEYICTMYDPTCLIVENYLPKFGSDTPARRECLMHQEAAGIPNTYETE